MNRRRRAMTPERAREVRKRGHEDAQEFAEVLGIGKKFSSDPQAKKDVIDSEGNSYSVKSGKKKWQIFLYSKTRFKNDYTFQGMNGLGKLFLKCINSFPESRKEYLKNKSKYKNKLKIPMKQLCKKLQEKRLLKAFLEKSLFNSGEVNFFVVKDNNIFHVFWWRDVVEILAQNISVENSKARTEAQFDDQKVIFRVNGKTIGEIEMRNDSEIHYREVKFWLDKSKTLDLLKSKLEKTFHFGDRVILYNKSIDKLRNLTRRNLPIGS